MATDTETAASGLHSQLQTLYPSKTSAQLWNMIGVTEMIGIDDFGAAETFTTADAPTVESWAVSKGIAELSFWALQRDNGGCPGTGGSDSCSGVSQSTWQFSHVWEAVHQRWNHVVTVAVHLAVAQCVAEPEPDTYADADPQWHHDASPGWHRRQRWLRERRTLAVDMQRIDRQHRDDAGTHRHARAEGRCVQFGRCTVHADHHGHAWQEVHIVRVRRRKFRLHRDNRGGK